MRPIRLLTLTLLIAGTVPLASPAAAPADQAPARLESGLLDATGPTRIIARFDERIPALSVPGLTIQHRFTTVPAFTAVATPAAMRALALVPTLAYLERDKPIAFDLDSATVASRAREVWSGENPISVGGNVVDGAGVGIAIVDTGLDQTHPDFDIPGKVGGQWQATAAGVVPKGPLANPISSHGTHVAGIAAGGGDASGGQYRGVADGATLYAFDIFVGTQSFGAMAFDWILANNATLSPPIRVVNNSWHCSASSCGHGFNPNQLHVALASALADAGIVVTWAAGNNEGDGGFSTMNPEATNPTPGIIGVANYKDEGYSNPILFPPGTRGGCLSSGSSWGASADPTTWPDVSAPGRSIISTWAFGPYVDVGTRQATMRNPVTGERTYRSQSGTSMAAPHLAGIVALMLQANPDLTPAEVEYIVKGSSDPLVGPANDSGCGIAYINADPSHPWNGANYAAGHGLIDAREAVLAASSFTGIPAVKPAPVDPGSVPGFVKARPGVHATSTHYFVGDDATSASYPDAAAPRIRPIVPGVSITHTTPPFAADTTFEALKVDVYMGTGSETPGGRLNPPKLRVTVEHLTAGGAVSLTPLPMEVKTWFVYPMQPVHRDLVRFFPTPVTVAAGERLRVRLSYVSDPYQGIQDPPFPGAIYTEGRTASRLVLGDRVALPATGSRPWCESRQDCAIVDATHPFEGLTCGNAPFRLSWDGPPGSALIFECFGVTHTCPVIGMPGDPDGHCEQEVELPHINENKGAHCTYVMPAGSRGGSGRCYGLKLIEDDD